LKVVYAVEKGDEADEAEDAALWEKRLWPV